MTARILTSNNKEMSPREKQVHDLVIQGASTKEICDKLGIANSTAKLHITSLLIMAGVDSRFKYIVKYHTGEYYGSHK